MLLTVAGRLLLASISDRAKLPSDINRSNRSMNSWATCIFLFTSSQTLGSSLVVNLWNCSPLYTAKKACVNGLPNILLASMPSLIIRSNSKLSNALNSLACYINSVLCFKLSVFELHVCNKLEHLIPKLLDFNSVLTLSCNKVCLCFDRFSFG